MNEEQIKRQFSFKIREDYEDFLKEWLSQEPEELVSYAEEISATKMLAKALPETTSTQNMEYLLRFENPLEVVRDRWMSYNSADMTDELDVYGLSKEYISTSKEPITVREFLELYPDDTFDMMTAGGFVYLTSEEVRKMLAGESTMGNPGCFGCDMEVTAEELLPQKIQSPSYANGTWHCLCYNEPDMEQEPTAMEEMKNRADWTIWDPWWYAYWVWHSTGDGGGYWCDHGWWEFDLDRYSASLSASMQIKCDDKNPTASGRVMKSGYGINQTVIGSARSNQSSAVTQPQNAVSYFPEFRYETYWRLLERRGNGRFEFQTNKYSTYKNRTHFSPIWMPDGNYTVNTWLIDAWTPDGMLSANLTDTLTIRGNL